MRSIRLSLILCFLVLLVLSLGAVSGLVYRTTQLNLTDGKESTLELLKANNTKHNEEEVKKLDKALRADALYLAQFVYVYLKFPDHRVRHLAPIGVLTTAPLPHGHLHSLLWIAQTPYSPPFRRTKHRNRLSWRIVNMRVSPKLSKLRIGADQMGQVGEFFQINLITGDVWRSDSLKDKNTFLPFRPKLFGKTAKGVVSERFDTLELEHGLRVRVVQAKVSSFGVYSPWSRRRKSRATTGPTIYIQAAVSTNKLDKSLSEFSAALARESARVEEEYEESLARLRIALVLINLGTLLTAILAGCLLVHWGLRPLRRLSEAVSKVSERDFRLHVSSSQLPVELRPVTDRLHRTLDMLQRAFAREKQAAADISHELRTPLAALMTTLELGLRKERSAEEYRELMTECQEAGQQMSHLVERLLALARLDAGVDHLRPRDVDVGHLAAQCAGLVRPLAEARGLRLSVQANGQATIKADPDKLREVLTNLLHNAIEYNKPDGAIELAVERDNGCLRMQVSDTGIGIPPEAKDHIFERFYRQDASRFTETESMHAGIGLALVKGYVDLMGGQITVDSVVGQGSTFRIDLPVLENDIPEGSIRGVTP